MSEKLSPERPSMTDFSGTGKVVPKRNEKKAITTSRVRKAPEHKKPDRNIGAGRKTEEIGTIAQFIDINSIPDELPISPTRGGANTGMRSYAPAPVASATHIAAVTKHFSPPSQLPNRTQPVQQRGNGQPMQRVVPPLPAMRPMQLSRGDEEPEPLQSARQQKDFGQEYEGGYYDDGYADADVYDERENDDWDDEDDDGGETYFGSEGGDGGESKIGSARGERRGGNDNFRPPSSGDSRAGSSRRSDRSAPPLPQEQYSGNGHQQETARARPKGREMPPKSSLGDGNDDDDFWEDDRYDNFADDRYDDYESPPGSAHSYDYDSPRHRQRQPARRAPSKAQGSTDRGRGADAKFSSRRPLEDKPVPQQQPMRKRSPVAKKRGGGTYAPPPPLPSELNSRAAADMRSRNENKEYSKPRDMLAYSRAPRETAYKPCSVSEYKMNHKPGRYVEIESLKPNLDSDELKAKRANAQRVKEFSKNLHNYNRQALRMSKKAPSTQEASSMAQSKAVSSSKLERMKEFSRNVPKPKVKSRPMVQGVMQDNYMTAQDECGMEHGAAIRMQELEAKHEESEAQLNAIKRSLGMR